MPTLGMGVVIASIAHQCLMPHPPLQVRRQLHFQMYDYLKNILMANTMSCNIKPEAMRVMTQNH